MASLCSMCVRMNFSKTTRPRDILSPLKDTLSIKDEKLFKVCRSISVSQSHYKWGTPTQSVKISKLYHNFLIDYCRDFSLILHVCTSLQVDSLVYPAWIFLHYYVHPTGGWTYYFCFFRDPASHLVSRHFRQQFLSYLYQIWRAGLLG